MVEHRTIRLDGDDRNRLRRLANAAAECLKVDRDLVDKYTQDEEEVYLLGVELDVMYDIVDTMDGQPGTIGRDATMPILNWRVLHREVMRARARDDYARNHRDRLIDMLEPLTR
jgi:hypothetical protein